MPSPLPKSTDTSPVVGVGGGQISPAVAVEVACHNGDRSVPHRVRHLGLEGAVALAQQHRHVVVGNVGDGEVGPPVAGEIARHEGDRVVPHRVDLLGLESAVAVAQEHRHVVEVLVDDGQVGAAVGGEVARHEGDRVVPHRIGHLGLEGAVAVAQQYRHAAGDHGFARRIAAGIDDGQVGASVAVEVARHDGVREGPHRVSHLGLEGAVTVAQQYRHGGGDHGVRLKNRDRR